MALGHFGAGALLARAADSRGPRTAFLAFAWGLAASHTLVLLGLPLGIVLGLLAAAACAYAALAATGKVQVPGLPARALAVLVALSLPQWAYCIAKPLWAFDPRTFWFFQGRVMFLNGRFDLGVWPTLQDHFGSDYLLLTHPDYPKLIGVLAAETATLARYWNEYLPKVAILVLQLCALVGVLELAGPWVAGALVIVGVAATPVRYLLSTGYADLYLGAFLAIGFGHACRAARAAAGAPGPAAGVEARAPAALPSALAAIALLPQLKNEGGVLALLLLAWSVVLGVWSVRDLGRAARFALPFAPALVWLVEKKVMHLVGDLAAGYSTERTLGRLRTAADWSRIAKGLLLPGWSVAGALGLLAAAAAVAARARKGEDVAVERRIFGLALGVCASYAVVLAFVYFSSPWPSLQKHLDSSVTRVTIPFAALGLWAAGECLPFRAGVSRRGRRS
jgi:hypothetical protein